jgi:hypothetical protein
LLLLPALLIRCRKEVEKGTIKISDQLKEIIRSRIDNGSNAAVVIGFVALNGTQFYGYGIISSSNQTTVDKNTIFDIDSMIKTLYYTWLTWRIISWLI